MTVETQFRDTARTLTKRHDSSPCTDRGMNVLATKMQVRRLTPTECERLQGFPDNHTLIDVAARKKLTQEEYAYIRKSRPEITASEACRLAKDGPRYKALGNSMAVNCMSWIGQRIQMCDEVLKEIATPRFARLKQQQ